MLSLRLHTEKKTRSHFSAQVKLARQAVLVCGNGLLETVMTQITSILRPNTPSAGMETCGMSILLALGTPVLAATAQVARLTGSLTQLQSSSSEYRQIDRLSD